MKLLKAMATVAGLTGVSRILGFIRDILTAAILGAGPVADAFFVALKLPNFFRRVTAEGAFSIAFVPLYTKTRTEDGQEQANLYASNALAVMLVTLIPFTLIALWLMPYILYAVAPGFQDDPVRYELAVELSRITFPYLLMMSLTALLGGIMNAHDRFAPFASAPIFFNLCLIIGLLVFTKFSETAGHAMTYGIALAGITQLLWLIYTVKRAGIKLVIKSPEWTPRIKKTFALMGPAAIGAGVMHINLFADLIIASLLEEGAISYLYYADRLNQLPLGMVGIAVGTALLPMLSRSIASDDTQEAQSLFNRAMEICLLLALPAAAALFVIPETLIGSLFERGAFTAKDTHISAMVLMGYAIGLPAYVAVKICSTAYWSQEDTVSPVKISILTTVLNIILSLILIGPFGVAGIATATGLIGWLQLTLLYRGMKGKTGITLDARFKRNIIKIALATLIMAAVLFAGDHLLSFDHWSRLIKLNALIALGGMSYGLSILLTGAIKPDELKHYLTRQKPKHPKKPS